MPACMVHNMRTVLCKSYGLTFRPRASATEPAGRAPMKEPMARRDPIHDDSSAVTWNVVDVELTSSNIGRAGDDQPMTAPPENTSNVAKNQVFFF